MKVVLIHGQNHRGSSCHMGRILADRISSPGEQTEFFLPRDLNHFCTGCFRCLEDEKSCPFYSEKEIILDAMEKAEVLIFTTPTYCMRASAPMKSFLDLTFTNWMVHRPRASMFHKRAVILSAAAGTGMKSAIKDIKTALTYWGIPEIYSFGAAVQATGWEQVADKKKDLIKNKLDKIAGKLCVQREPAAGIKTRFLFNMMRKMQAAGWGSSPAEKQYWEEQGWLGKARPWK
ncbi:MAG: flavodoxin family protein [Candidatus Limivicinus sp.]|jgi:multimeric flavodoxin WrbA